MASYKIATESEAKAIGDSSSSVTPNKIYIKSYSGSWKSIGSFILLELNQTINVNV